MKNGNAIIASILALALAASPLLANASDHTSSESSGSSNNSNHSDPAPVPAERSAPSPVERSVTSPVTHVPSEQAATQPPRPPRRVPVPPSPRYQPHTPVHDNNGNGSSQPSSNANADSNPWDWDDGAAWIGTVSYWGDGFWGPLVTGLASSEYIVAPGSPGAQLLQAYGLTQTPCGPPNLVEIFGPGASEICALPNDQVGPGLYRVDTQRLTLISSS